MKKKIFTNIVEEKEMREIQSRTLQILKDALKKSFGPYGSNTIITKVAGNGNNIVVNYTKDGHKILQSLLFQDVIETSVKENIEDITRNIVLKVGDGTTSAIILSSIIFDHLCRLESERTPYQIISDFKKAVDNIKKEIMNNVQEFNPETAYKIALISTNGNKEVANNIKDIYEDFGKDVHIDVGVSPNEKTICRIYDGMTLDTGYSDTAFINTNKGTSYLRNPHIYVFEDPIDTPEMGGFLDAIIGNNIIIPYTSNKLDKVKPTVIFAPKISRDFSSYMEKISKLMFNISNPLDRPPLLIITNIHESDKYYDMAQLCGVKSIRKYINPEQYKKDVELGLAPTVETIIDFAGTADVVESDSFKTKIINPKLMYKEGTTEYSDVFNGLIRFLETELEKSINEKNDSLEVHKLRKRIQSLKSNLVEYLVGGVSISDRDSLRDLVEDAVKNCMSASKYGVGYAANFEGLRASNKLLCEDDKHLKDMYRIIKYAYFDTLCELYKVSGIKSYDEMLDIVNTSIVVENKPYDVRDKCYSDNVLSSIMSDIAILDTISKIMTLMITSNQFICPDFIYNKYSEGK
mgnify:CR=1 FL=1